VKVGDLVRMKTHETGLIGIVVDIHPHSHRQRNLSPTRQVGIRWFHNEDDLVAVSSGKVDWEPESWLEVVSASR